MHRTLPGLAARGLGAFAQHRKGFQGTIGLRSRFEQLVEKDIHVTRARQPLRQDLRAHAQGINRGSTEFLAE